MKIRYHVVGVVEDASYDLDWCASLDDAIQCIRKKSVESSLFSSYRIESFQLASSLSCRIIDHQLFIE